MARYTSMEHLKFLLKDVHNLHELFTLQRYSHLNWEQAWMIVESAKLLADRDMAPYFKIMDENPARYDGKGRVATHPQLKTIIRQAAEQGWIGGAASFDHGGLQLPMMVYNAGQHIFQSANNGCQGYFSLSAGAAALITSFGNEAQIKKFVPKVYGGEWQATMALTEPQAGSSLTDIISSASPLHDGFYSIKGQKIFISAGQHDACDNFIHLTLARIEGAPPGVKGISLFIIPKFWPEEDGTLTPNDVFCAGDFQKMGQRGYSTTHLVFGDENKCKGWLVGEANKGLSYMFQMMNEARIGVGQTAASVATAAYYASLDYAKERPQGRLASEKNPLHPPTLIINHADVQRMLLTQKAITEGSLSLAMECNRLYDLAHHAKEGERHAHWLLLELLTPIVKTYSSEQGSRSASLAIQVLGGYGFTTDFPVQQHYRDLKIMSIYEGTTGIQSLDLLGRKVVMEKGQALRELRSVMNATIADAEKLDDLKGNALQLQQELNRIDDVMRHLGKFAAGGDVDRYLADATVFMEMLGLQIIAWQWIKMAVAASQKITQSDFSDQTPEFYRSKIHTMKFFYRYELPHAEACAKTLMNPEILTNGPAHLN
ncbi:MAG TPA: acyl-CoA dehydrogenase [Cyclobacteriaceae bacterium]|nr:acyl-CoA dehydrogenase [Cyclobacteriaceae bacterium]